jgi:L-seryl-tRNA(Ser) seleniumtransferase
MEQIRALAERLLPAVERAFRGVAEVALIETKSQIGSGALPISLLPSAALALRPPAAHCGSAVEALAHDLRALPIPVIGRIEAGRVILDLRCLEDAEAFIAQLDALSPRHRHPRESGGPEPAPGLNRGRPSQEPAGLDSRFRGNDGQRPEAGPFGPDR